MGGIDPKLDCILVILPSTHSPTGIIMQRKDNAMEWIFLACKQSTELKMYVEKTDLIIKGRIRPANCQELTQLKS